MPVYMLTGTPVHSQSGSFANTMEKRQNLSENSGWFGFRNQNQTKYQLLARP